MIDRLKTSSTPSQDVESEAGLLREAFDKAGQGQVFRFWDELSAAEKKSLLGEAREIDLAEIAELVALHLGGKEQEQIDFAGLQPAPYLALPTQPGEAARREAARLRGEEALRQGKVAAFTVAGGQGTRLGYEGPKGTFPVTPVKGKPLFQVFAEKILAARRRYQAAIPWLIMTSHANHEETERFFRENHFFGLPATEVTFFRQGRMPAVDLDGKILLASKGAIAMSPDGHGGSLRALCRSGSIQSLQERGIEVISYFQVDNPLVQAIDPLFIGVHLEEESEMSSKMIPKAYPAEKVGVFTMANGKMMVVEYSDLPAELADRRDAAGELLFRSGSIAIHLLSPSFVKKIGSREGGDGPVLPFHRADKKIPTLDDRGEAVRPESPNGVKFEMFVFDALPFARNPLVIETRREDEFSPVKNAEGLDSPATCRKDQLKQFARWLEAAGVAVEKDDEGVPGITLEVSPLFATDERSFAESWARLEPKPSLREGLTLE
jgi:UDP-N-acetylglucosamine/UDP-N-acetylgalactosamine diphosphorylase